MGINCVPKPISISSTLKGLQNPDIFESGQKYYTKPYNEVNWKKDFRIYEQIEIGAGFATIVLAIHLDDRAKVNFACNPGIISWTACTVVLSVRLA